MSPLLFGFGAVLLDVPLSHMLLLLAGMMIGYLVIWFVEMRTSPVSKDRRAWLVTHQGGGDYWVEAPGQWGKGGRAVRLWPEPTNRGAVLDLAEGGHIKLVEGGAYVSDITAGLHQVWFQIHPRHSLSAK